MEGGRVRPSHTHGRCGVVPSRAPDIVGIFALQIRIPHHTFGRRHPQRFPMNFPSVEEQGYDQSGSDPSQCVPSWNRMFRSAQLGQTCTPTSASRARWDGDDRNGGLELSV